MKKSVFILLLISACSFSLFAQVKQPAPPEPKYEANLDSAYSHYSRDEYDKVIELLKDFPESDTAYARAMDELALTYLAVEKWEPAITTALKGLTLRSQYKRHFYEILGAAYDENKEY